MNALFRLAIPVFALASLCAGASLAARPISSDARARGLYEDAIRRLERGTSNQRQVALKLLEQAALLDPGEPRYPLVAGRVCLGADMLLQARHWAQGVLARDSSNADAHHLLGSIWRRDWIITVDERSLDRAIVHLSRGARLADRADRWVALVPLLIERDEMEGAIAAAERALELEPGVAEPLLAGAYVAYRSGDLARSRTLFQRALAGLPSEVRERFEDIGPLLDPAEAEQLETLNHEDRRARTAAFWRDADPDLVTPENEAQLEYWSRAAHAFFLYWVPQRHGWDLRGELLVRFGPPAWADRNPMFVERIDTSKGTWLLWGYPQLGMRVWMQAGNPLGSYGHPQVMPYRPPAAYPDSIASHPGLVAVGRGTAIFSRLPPRIDPIPMTSVLARFEGSTGRRLLGHAEIPGAPADSFWMEWVVRDSTGREVGRDAKLMSISACAPTEARAASFTADLPAGRYRVGLSARGKGRRAVYSGMADLTRPGGGLALSDVVVTCGPPQPAFVSGRGVRLEPNPGARVSRSDQLTAYFEIYHLTPEGGGASRFEYVYTVRSARKDPRTWIQRVLTPRRLPPPIVASRSEESQGTIRRQYLTVPIRELPDGPYELEIRVRDLVSGAETAGVAAFTRGD